MDDFRRKSDFIDMIGTIRFSLLSCPPVFQNIHGVYITLPSVVNFNVTESSSRYSIIWGRETSWSR